MAEFSVIGERLPRVDAKEKVTGKAKYAADYSLPDMLWCKLLRSPYPHARILNIDTSRAERLPGVKAVVTGKDFGGWTWGWMPATRDEPPLAVDKVRYMAEAVAGVAAVDEGRGNGRRGTQDSRLR
jgi:CO/xanthine dehydrogenase Mo-binding subunit